MYFSKIIENKDRDLRIKKILSDVLKIDRDVDSKSDKKNNSKISELLSSDMINKIKKALK